jgi:hypothetical protein
MGSLEENKIQDGQPARCSVTCDESNLDSSSSMVIIRVHRCGLFNHDNPATRTDFRSS